MNLCAHLAGREGAVVFGRAEYTFLGVLDTEHLRDPKGAVPR